MIKIELTRSIMLKCEPVENKMTYLFTTYGQYVSWTLQHISELYNDYAKIPQVEKSCFICNEKKTVSYKNLNKEGICSNCFSRIWSEYTLFKTFKPTLINMAKNNKIAVAHQGYYYGAISSAVKIFKSFAAKSSKREEEINRAKEHFLITEGKLNNMEFDIKKTMSSINLGKHLTAKLAQLEREKDVLQKELKNYRRKAERKHISFPMFRNNEIYFGKQGMFQFKKNSDGYTLLISDYIALRTKIELKLKIGDLRKIHKVCKKELTQKEGLFFCQNCNVLIPQKECRINHQEQFIIRCIEKQEDKRVYPKMIRKGDSYYFILPAKDFSEAKSLRVDIEKWIRMDKEIEFCCLTFGIKTPITLSIIKEGRIKTIRKFGDGSLYQKNEIKRKIRADIFNGIGERYKHSNPHKDEKDKFLHWKKRNALIKSNKKIGFRNQRFCNYYNQKLSHDVIDYIKNNCRKPLIIFRDTKMIKDISYKGELMRRLSRWSVQQQASFIEYKAYLNNISVYKIPYKNLKSLKCWKCGEEAKEKLTTQILNFEKKFECEKCKANYNFGVVSNNNLFLKVKEAVA